MTPATSTSRTTSLGEGSCLYRLTPHQVHALIATVIEQLSDEDFEILRELAEEREIPSDLTTDIGRDGVDSLWEQTLDDAARSPGFSQVRVHFAPGEVREIAGCGAPPLSEAEFRKVAETELGRFDLAASMCPECGVGEWVIGEHEPAVNWWHTECSAGCGWST